MWERGRGIGGYVRSREKGGERRADAERERDGEKKRERERTMKCSPGAVVLRNCQEP